MKIGIFSDIHASYTSSIMPLSSNCSKWTSRLRMVELTFSWMKDLFEEEKVDLIVNCGDMFDSHTLRAEELSLFSSIPPFEVPSYHLVGNHELLNSNYYSCSILNREGSIVIDSPKTVCLDNVKLGFLPYMKADSIDSNVLKEIECDYLFSHIDIKGSHLRPDYIMDTGVDPSLLQMYCPNVFNGHLHTHEIVLKNEEGFVMNIGSATSKSFSDNNLYFPHVMIFNTDDNSYKFYKNPNAVLFRRVGGASESEVIKRIDACVMENTYSYILRVSCPYECCESIRRYLQKLKSVIAYRVVGKIENRKEIINNDNTLEVSSSDDVDREFLRFLESNSEKLKFNIDDYKKVLAEVE